MVKIILNQKDLQNILAWAGSYEIETEKVGIPFSNDEKETTAKIKEKLK